MKNSIEAIKAAEIPSGKPLETQVDLGCNFYVQAEVKNPQKLFVDVGFGFFLELTQDEALDFIGKKNQLLETKAKALTEESTKIKTNIKLVINGLRELQGLSPEDLTRKDHYDPLSC